MTSIRNRSYSRKKRLSVILLNFSLLSELKFSNQPTEPLEINLPIASIPITTPAVPNYIEEDL